MGRVRNEQVRISDVQVIWSRYETLVSTKHSNNLPVYTQAASKKFKKDFSASGYTEVAKECSQILRRGRNVLKLSYLKPIIFAHTQNKSVLKLYCVSSVCSLRKWLIKSLSDDAANPALLQRVLEKSFSLGTNGENHFH